MHHDADDEAKGSRSSKVTVVQQSRAINNSSGNSGVPQSQLKYQCVEQELFQCLL